MKSFYSNGKLLLTGEYAVLDGALSLAVPTSFGQSLKVDEIDTPQLIWKSRDDKGAVWFESVFETETIFSDNVKKSENPVSQTLLNIFKEAKKLNPDFLKGNNGYSVETSLDFPRDWGLGSSSTLINNIAQWAEVDAFQLLWNAFSGSGYDIACAQRDSPIVYQLKEGKPLVNPIDFNPSFSDSLYFIHLGKKQNSQDGIARYQKMAFDVQKLISQISEITENVIRCSNLSNFGELLSDHEQLISKAVQLPTVKESLFPDYEGAIKSLGAWGGDFILAAGDENAPKYFKEKGFSTVVPFAKMILSPRD